MAGGLSPGVGVKGRGRVAVVIPSFKACTSIVEVVNGIGVEVDHIIVVDDACPEGTGHRVQEEVRDPRVEVLFNARNRGVGGATVAGYLRAVELGAAVCVKLDADGQMDPALIPALIEPILSGEADYTKGNRFFHIRDVTAMPFARLVGNAGLSFFSKLSSGYWNVFDPTNGFTAIHGRCLKNIELEKLDERFFFESDMLFRLHLIDAVVADMPMRATYGDETSNLNPLREIPRFFIRHVRNLLSRIFYEYFLRDFNLASVQLLVGLLLVAFGLVYGGGAWYANLSRGVESPAGTVGIVAISMIVGFVLLQGFFSFDYARIPRKAVHHRLR